MADFLQLGTGRLTPAPLARSKCKLNVYTAEFNVVMGSYRYLPFSTGLLRAYALTDPQIQENYQFMPFLYEMDTVKGIWNRFSGWDAPDVFAFSVSMWNEQLNLAVAKSVKETYGDRVLIIFGGCQVPYHPIPYMEKHPFIDVCVRGEGEEAFKDVLVRYISSGSFRDIPDVTYRVDDGTRFGMLVENEEHKSFSKNLDTYPSPYLTGLFDDLIAKQTPNHKFQAILETNRGCNWNCDFCLWGGGGLMTRYRFHSMEYVKDEISWTGKNHIEYVFGADSNWGQHPRDMELTQHIVKTKQDCGYPSKFRVCYGKNSDEKIFAIGTLLHEHNLEKGITLARQSNDETTLANIHRANIRLETYRNLQEKFNDKDVPVYSELILALPGETVASWKRGIDELLTAGLKNQLFCYLLQVLPNTGLDAPEYRKQHGIKTRMVELTEIHGTKRSEELVKEYEEIVIATKTMPYQDWRYACKFSWMTMLLHSMKAGFFIMAWLWDRFRIPPSDFISTVVDHRIIGKNRGVIRGELRRWDELLDRIAVFGESRGQILEGYGDIYWDVEEAALLRVAENWDFFYEDLRGFIWLVLAENDVMGKFKDTELDSVLSYQQLRMPSCNKPLQSHQFLYNTPEYFEHLFGSAPAQLEWGKDQIAFPKPKDWNGDKERFARETILWGRKSGTMLVPCEWQNIEGKENNGTVD